LIREKFFSCEQQFAQFVVHGYTPVAKPDIRSNRINIDTGVLATGRLTCIVIEGTVVMPLIDVREWSAMPPVSASIGIHRRG
jgi:serine/threonine protein phosphatase 1